MEKNLLTSFLELYTLSDNVTSWSIANFAKNPPRLFRLQKIDSLMKALNINGTYEQFLYGEFLYEEGRQNCTEFKKRVEENYSSIFGAITMEEEEDSDFQFVFEVLFRYRIKLNQLINVKSTVIEASGINRIPIIIMLDIESKLQNDIAGIDRILCYLINPKRIAYTKEELKTKYNYPDVDLDEIDLDWF